jgi:hypothetical protein
MVNLLLGLKKLSDKKGSTAESYSCSEQERCLTPSLRLWPDLYVGFNMGLTCPDYSWDITLKAMGRCYAEL